MSSKTTLVIIPSELDASGIASLMSGIHYCTFCKSH